MKSSAIIRIVIYSILIILLLGLLGTVLTAHLGWHDLEDFLDYDEDDDEAAGLTAALEPVVLEPDQVTDIKIKWISGDILVKVGDTDRLEIRESAAEKPMVYSLRDGKLSIQYSKSMKKVGLDLGNTWPEKDLTVTVPEDWTGRKLEIESVSADVEVQDIQLGEIEYDGVSGRCELINCKVGELSVQTVSGNVKVDGEIQELECESVSADCDVTVTNVPQEISMEGVSGNLDLTLPKDAGFTARMDGLQKDLDTDFPVTHKNGKFIAGDGSCEIEMEGISGKAKIHQAE